MPRPPAAPSDPAPSLEDLIYRSSLVTKDPALGAGDRVRVLALSLLAYGSLGAVAVGLGARATGPVAVPRTVTLSFVEEEVPLLAPPPPPAGAPQGPRSAGVAAEPTPALVPSPEAPPRDTPEPAPASGPSAPAGPAGGVPGGTTSGIAGGTIGGTVGGTPGGVVPPRFDAAYLQNPPPDYPALSRRLGEEGRTLLRVLISPEGLPRDIQLQASSGFLRLDQAALQTVRRWRFVPARRGDEALAAWVLVPIRFDLES